MTVNLLQAAGYWLFSGTLRVGDWAGVIEGGTPHWAWRRGLAAFGGAAYWGVVLFSLHALSPFLGPGPGRWRRAVSLTVIPYLAGGILYVTAGLLNPVGPLLVLISAAAASFGGTSGPAWMAQAARRTPVSAARRPEAEDRAQLSLARRGPRGRAALRRRSRPRHPVLIAAIAAPRGAASRQRW